MIQKSILFLLLFYNTQSLIADTSTINLENALMWKISGNNLKQDSYLFGTIHAIPIDDYFLGKNTLKKIKECQHLIMELELTSIDETKISKLSLLPEDKTAQDYLSPEDYEKLEDFLIQKFGMSKAIFENVYSRLKPFFVEQFILISIIGDNKKIYEEELNRISEDNNLSKSGLETIEEQLQVFENIPLDIQYKNLIKGIDDYDKQNDNYLAIVKAYKRQDINYLNQQIESEYADDMSIYKTYLLDERNTNWLNKIIPLIQKKACFIAVGAGHLSGEKGLITLLRKIGYTITPEKK